MSKIIKLYKGDNGEQEFWESEDGLLLARHKSSPWWVAYRNSLTFGSKSGDDAICSQSVERLATLVKDALSLSLQLCKEQEWVDAPGKPKMILRRVHV